MGRLYNIHEICIIHGQGTGEIIYMDRGESGNRRGDILPPCILGGTYIRGARVMMGYFHRWMFQKNYCLGFE